MRCEVCGCKLSRRDKVCPNCGFTLEKRTTIKEVTFQQKEIESQKKVVVHKQVKKPDPMKNMGNKYLIVVGLIVFGLVFLIMSAPRNIERMSLDEIIKNGRDDNYSTAEVAREYRNTLMTELADLGYVDILAAEQVYENDSVISVSCALNAQREETNITDHAIFYSIDAGRLNSLTYDGISHIDDFSLDKLDKLSDILGYDSLKDILSKIDIKYENGYVYEDDIFTIRVGSSYHSGMYVQYRIAGKGYTLNN